MKEALIGLVGVILGVWLNEFFRHKRRIENYSQKVFDRRLEIYEKFIQLLHESAASANEMLQNTSLPIEDRKRTAFEAGLKIMEYADFHELHLNDEITVHCGAAFVDLPDIIDMPGGKKRDAMISRFNKSIAEAKEMVRSECGIKELDRLFRSITRASYSSPVIEYFRTQKEKYQRATK